MSVRVVMLGRPGAGKGTQAVRFAETHGVPRISTGDILREAVQAGTTLGREAKAIMDRGQLVGDEVMVGIVKERLAQPDAGRGFVLDGFPRTVAQATALDGLLDGRAPLVIVDIDVPADAIVRRLGARRICQSCGWIASSDATVCRNCGGTLIVRADDSEPVVRERLRVFEQSAGPLRDYYRHRETFRSVNGDEAPERVAGAIDDAVRSALQGVRS